MVVGRGWFPDLLFFKSLIARKGLKIIYMDINNLIGKTLASIEKEENKEIIFKVSETE